MPQRVVMVTNIPAPYRIPVFESLAGSVPWRFDVVYCSGKEPDREWQLQQGQYAQHYLETSYVSFRGRFIHFNPDLWGLLKKLKPDVVITTGFNPSHLMAFAYARLHGATHVAMTDGTYLSESKLSRAHSWVRRLVYRSTETFVGASDGSIELYRSYGLPASRCFKSVLCANNAIFEQMPEIARRYDLLLAGRLVALKNPFFALDVAQQLSRKLKRRVTMAVLGSGELEEQVRAHAQTMSDNVSVDFLGFIQQAELPRYYAAAKLLVFPTSWETWGVVANEALAAGVPVVVSPEAGVAGELVRDGETGFVRALDLTQWVDACATLLTDATLWQAMSDRGRVLVREYSYERAAEGLRQAVDMALSRDARHMPQTPAQR